MISSNQQAPLATHCRNRSRQRGVVLPLVVVGLMAIIAMVGLAIDSSHAFVNKTRLQNMADSAALAAAKEYDKTGDTILSTVAANSNFGRNTDGSGNFEIDGEYDAGNISVVVQYSESLNPFVSTGIGPFVRVISTGFNMATGFASIVGISSINIAASAVAGPSPTINYACNIAPLVTCAADLDPANYYGFVENAMMVLKPSPGDHDDIGPGNYKLLRLECPGGACIREAMAGSYDECASTYEPVETEPGVTAGPTSQGFNTRFGEYAGPMNGMQQYYPADVNTTSSDPLLDTAQQEIPAGSGTFVDQICVGTCDCGTEPGVDEFGNPIIVAINCKGVSTPPSTKAVWANDEVNWPEIYHYDEYMAGMPAAPYPDYTVPERRVLAMPVADCSGDQSGQSTLDIIGFACYFMLQPIGGGQDKNIFGQFVEDCPVGGTSGMDPGATPGPYVIQLYKDPDSTDS